MPFEASAWSSRTFIVPHSRPSPQACQLTAGVGAPATVVVGAGVVGAAVLDGRAIADDGAPDTGGRRNVSSGR